MNPTNFYTSDLDKALWQKNDMSYVTLTLFKHFQASFPR